jgi:CRP/FNR family transcriptional regulator, cyclic AMP receptor protein
MQTLTESPTAAEIEARVAAHPFFAGMKRRHLDVLTRYCKPVRFKTDQYIFRAGEPAGGFYLIEKGSVALEGSVMEHGPITTDIVSAGEPLGWSWLFPPYRWHFDARAIEPTIAIYFDGKTLRKHYDEDLTLGHDLFKRISEVMVRRLQSARRKLVQTHVGAKRKEI